MTVESGFSRCGCSTPDFVAQPEDALRCYFGGSSTRWKCFLSTLPVAGFSSSPRAMPCLVRFRKARVAGMTFRPMTGLTIDAGVIEVINMSTDLT